MDQGGRSLVLSKELGRGGEAAVYELVSEAKLVAKLYHRPVASEKAEKLARMARVASDELQRIGAWPVSTVHDGRADGKVVGVVLPKVSGYSEIHELYSPAHRKFKFPAANWKFLVHAARNLASAVATVHKNGHVIGDVNQGNVMVSGDGVVKLIDCDSFQVTADGRVFFCEVGVGHFTPPELQGKTFRGVVRTANHDAFGLAVLFFHLLFMGRHPFAGRFHGTGDMPIEKAIQEYRFAFSQSAAARQMTPPPKALPLANVSFSVASLFERAFRSDGVRESGRPRAEEWVAALDGLRQEVRTCERYAIHCYWRTLKQCPWCELERGGAYFFISLVDAKGVTAGFDLIRVWAAIAAIPEVGVESPPDPANRQAVGRPVLLGVRVERVAEIAMGVNTILSIFVGAWLGSPREGLAIAAALGAGALVLHSFGRYQRERKRRQEILDVAKQAFAATKERWLREVGGSEGQYAAKRRELNSRKSEYESIPAAQQRERLQLDARREELQRKKFLESHFIDKAQIRGVGPGLKASLASYGIETAADITFGGVDAVPGFGAARVAELLSWRASIEGRFRFDPRKGVDPSDLAGLDQKYRMLRQRLEQVLRVGAQELTALRSTTLQRRAMLRPEFDRLAQREAQAQADVAML